MRKLLSLRSSLLFAIGIFALGLFIIPSFFRDAQPALAAAGDIQVTVTQEANAAPIVGATVQVMCTGGAFTALTGSPVTNGSGVVSAAPQVASSCDNSDTIQVKVIATGYVTTTNASAGTYLAASNPNIYTVTNVPFTYRIDTLTNEIGTNIMPTSGTPWTASGGLSMASQLYNSGHWYLALSGTGNLAFDLDGYVTANITASPSASSQTLSTVDYIDVRFAYKITGITSEASTALTTGLTVTTGDAFGTTCTLSSGAWYCAVPLANTGIAISVVKDGYVTNTSNSFASDRTAVGDLQVTKAVTGVQFSHKFLIVDELGAALTVTSATAGASSVACTISTSTAYCPVLLADDNTLTNGLVAAKDGYVTTTAADVPLVSNRAAGTTAQGVTTLTTANGLDFAAKATVVIIGTATVIPGATVTAGNSAAVTCSENGTTGIYYCAVPLADTDTTIHAVATGYNNAINNFTDRTAATDVQQAITIQMNTTGGSSGGGGGGGGSSNNTTNTTTTTTNTTTTTTTTNTETINIVDRINAEKDTVFAQSNPESYFINTGTDSTMGLGSGERGAAVSSFKEAYGKSPATAADWTDILNIANGRWPITVNKAVEARAYTNFKLVYGRNADMKNSTDVNALKMMGYGVRGTVTRDMATERAAIARFKAVFGHNPATAREWNVMRAIGYSGVVK